MPMPQRHAQTVSMPTLSPAARDSMPSYSCADAVCNCYSEHDLQGKLFVPPHTAGSVQCQYVRQT